MNGLIPVDPARAEMKTPYSHHVGKTTINHPPVITIFIGGMVTITKWVVYDCFTIITMKGKKGDHLFQFHITPLKKANEPTTFTLDKHCVFLPFGGDHRGGFLVFSPRTPQIGHMDTPSAGEPGRVKWSSSFLLSERICICSSTECVYIYIYIQLKYINP